MQERKDGPNLWVGPSNKGNVTPEGPEFPKHDGRPVRKAHPREAGGVPRSTNTNKLRKGRLEGVSARNQPVGTAE